MPTGQSNPTASSTSADVAEIARALTRVAYLTTRARMHDRVRALAGVPLDRAAVVILRQLAESEALRSGELAARLGVEAPHVTRQVQRLQKSGYVDRVPDPGDRRAQLIQLTAAGREATDRIHEVTTMAVQAALAEWSPEECHQLATLFHRMVDDFLAHSAEDEVVEVPPPPFRRET